MPMTVRTSNHQSVGTVGESSKRSPSYSPTSSLSPFSPYLKHHDLEEDHALCPQKKSVLAKVKEKARRLRFSLSKRRLEDENHTPSWGVTLDDDEEEEDPDAEYLGAPMYESEVAPEVYKENARQHPRANPVISEKHVLHTNVREEVMMEQQDKSSSSQTSPVKSTTTAAEKLIPAYAEGSSEHDYAPNSAASKILQGLVAVTRTPSANNDYYSQSQASPPSLSAKSSSSSSGASVKEYLKIKFEPGSDDKALSEVISEAMSPRKTTTNHNNNGGGVIEKMRVAVNSLLRNEEQASPQQCAVVKTNNNAQEVGHEGNHVHGRTLQAN